MRLAPGSRLGSFEIVARLGAGGMDEVYRARDPRLEREVAIKILSERYADDHRRGERLRREARAASRVNHPNVVTVYEVGEQDGLWYVVSELVKGRTLRSLLAEGPLSATRVVDLGAQLAAGLAAAHEQGIVHRDLKPENAIVTADGRLKILDFGIARLVDDRRETIATAETETEEGALLGTSGFTSPEQARGETVDHRTDLFAVGAILFEALTGEPAFRGAGTVETLSAVLRDDPLERPVAKAIPFGLSRVLGRCLAKSPALRFQSARDLAFALSTASSGSGRFSLRAAVRWSALALAIVALTLGIRYSLQPRPIAIRTVAVLPLKSILSPVDGIETAYLGVGLAEALISRLAALEGLEVRPIGAVRRYSESRDPLAAGRELRVDAVLDGTIQQSGNRLRLNAQLLSVRGGKHLWSGTFEESVAGIFEIQDELALRMADALQPALSAGERATLIRHDSNDPVAFGYFLEGRYLWGRRDDESLRKAAIAFERAVAREPGFARAHAALGDALALRQGGRDLYETARHHAEECVRLDPRLADCHLALALIAPHDLNWERAESEYRLALTLEPGNALALHRYGEILVLWGQFDRGLELLLRARELDPVSPIMGVDLAKGYWFARRSREALEILGPVLESDPDFSLAHLYLGESLLDLGRTDEALAALRRFVEIENTPLARGILGRALAKSGDAVAARRLLDEVRATRLDEAGHLVAPAVILVGLGESSAALDALERVVASGTNVIELAIHPYWEPLHGEPRFAAMLESLRLPYRPASTD